MPVINVYLPDYLYARLKQKEGEIREKYGSRSILIQLLLTLYFDGRIEIEPLPKERKAEMRVVEEERKEERPTKAKKPRKR